MIFAACKKFPSISVPESLHAISLVSSTACQQVSMSKWLVHVDVWHQVHINSQSVNRPVEKVSQGCFITSWARVTARGLPKDCQDT